MTKEKEDLDRFLAYLENRISKIRQNLQKSKNFEADETFIQQIVALAKEIIKFFGIDSALEEKRRIYGNIVDFLKGKGSKRGAEHVYLSAAHFWDRLSLSYVTRLIRNSHTEMIILKGKGSRCLIGVVDVEAQQGYALSAQEITNWVWENHLLESKFFTQKTSADREMHI